MREFPDRTARIVGSAYNIGVNEKLMKRRCCTVLGFSDKNYFLFFRKNSNGDIGTILCIYLDAS